MCSQNTGLSEYQRRASQLWTAPSPSGGREVGRRQPEPERDKLGPRDSIPYQNVSRLPVANQVFLGSWTVYIHREGRSQRSAPQRRHTAHLRQRSCCHPGDRTAGVREVIRRTVPGESALPSTWSPELLRPGKGTKRRSNRVCAFVEYPRTST